MLQHAVDGVEQFAHDCTNGLQRFFAVRHEMLEIAG